MELFWELSIIRWMFLSIEGRGFLIFSELTTRLFVFARTLIGLHRSHQDIWQEDPAIPDHALCLGYCPLPETVYIRGPIKGYIEPYYNYCPTVSEGGAVPNLCPKPLIPMVAFQEPKRQKLLTYWWFVKIKEYNPYIIIIIHNPYIIPSLYNPYIMYSLTPY